MHMLSMEGISMILSIESSEAQIQSHIDVLGLIETRVRLRKGRLWRRLCKGSGSKDVVPTHPFNEIYEIGGHDVCQHARMSQVCQVAGLQN